MTISKAQVALLGLLVLGPAGCQLPTGGESSSTSTIESTSEAVGSGPGALVEMNMKSQVAVLLDEVPAGPLREAAARDALQSGTKSWVERARRQTKLASYRLVFRGGFYANKGPLPLPSETIWEINLGGKPRRAMLNGHDVVSVDYTFRTYLLTDAASPGIVEPALADVGGTWDEPLVLPADPELLLQRTGFACMNEFEFPPNSVFEENVHYYYDQTCGVETPDTAACHLTQFPTESCQDALDHHVGAVSTALRFTRVAYTAALATRYRVGAITNSTGADLAVFRDDMVNEHRFYYRYFDGSSCDLQEGTVAKAGWRRLLTFSASVRNDGTRAVHIGDPRDPNNPWVQSHVFEFSDCHKHYHFSHYGEFGYNGAPGRKRAFCLEDTSRYHNDEPTPLTAVHQSCEYQGIGAGWGDEYNFGLPGQWIDVTDVDTTRPHDLTFKSNTDQFMCEGQTLDVNNRPVDPFNQAHLVFDPSNFSDANGNVVSRIRCAFPANWNKNNFGAVSVQSPGGSFVTEPCTRGQVGPLRDCGFTAAARLHACTPGQTITLQCHTKEAVQTLRLCEMSEALHVGTACTLRESVANAIVDSRGQAVTFTCPAVRDAATPGTGGYAVYAAPVVPSENDDSPITCTGW